MINRVFYVLMKMKRVSDEYIKSNVNSLIGLRSKER